MLFVRVRTVLPEPLQGLYSAGLSRGSAGQQRSGRGNLQRRGMTVARETHSGLVN